MGIRNFFQELNNPYIVDSFNDLYDNHYKALEMFCYDTYANDYKRYLTICLNQASGSYSKYHRHQMPSRQSDFETKKWFVDMKEHILDSYREDQEFRELKHLIETYPYGVADICYNKYHIVITDVGHISRRNTFDEEIERELFMERIFNQSEDVYKLIEEKKELESLWGTEGNYITNGIYKGIHSEKPYNSEGCVQLCLRTLCNFKKLLMHKKEIELQDRAVREKVIEMDKENEKRNTINKAKSLSNYYSLGFKHYFPNISSGSIDYPTAKSILWKEMQIKDWSEMLRRISTWDNVKGIPYYFFWYYYPTRFSNVSYESERARKLIWNFKDGKPTDLSIERIIINKLRSTFGSSILKELSFVCIPASSAVNNNIRYKYFSENVCKELGMMNAFPKIKIIKDKTPAHLSPTHTAEPAEYSFDTSFFRGANIILFDDVITTGHSMAEFKRIFERQLGAHVICAISIGRTYSDYNGEQRKPHPYTGTL